MLEVDRTAAPSTLSLTANTDVHMRLHREDSFLAEPTYLMNEAQGEYVDQRISLGAPDEQSYLEWMRTVWNQLAPSETPWRDFGTILNLGVVRIKTERS